MDDATAKVIQAGMSLIDRVWKDRILGPGCKATYQLLWLLADCRPGRISVRSEDLGAFQGKTRNAAAQWIKHLVKNNLIEVVGRNKRRGTLEIYVWSPNPSDRHKKPDPQLLLPLNPELQELQEPQEPPPPTQSAQPEPGETPPNVPGAQPRATVRETVRQRAFTPPETLRRIPETSQSTEPEADRRAFTPSETLRRPQEPRKQETNSPKSQEPNQEPNLGLGACSSASLVIDEPAPTPGELSAIGDLLERNLEQRLVHRGRGFDKHLSAIGDLSEPCLEHRLDIPGRGMDKHVTETNEQIRTRLVEKVLRKVGDPDMGAHLATYAADAVLLYGLSESMLNGLLDTTERKRRENSIDKTSGAYFNFRLTKMCRLHAPDCPWLKPKGENEP